MKQLTVPGQLDSLSVIGDYIKTIAAEAGLDKKRTYRLRLAVDEIATNIINYGYARNEQHGTIELSANVVDNDLVVTLEDTAPPFDPFNHELPDEQELEDPLEERPIGGLGIFLAIENVDEFRYEYVDGHNLNIFLVQLNEADNSD